jgi:hypothetical protein
METLEWWSGARSFGLSAKRTSPFKTAGTSVQSTAGNRGVRISGSNAGYTTFRGSVRVLATHSIRQFPLQFPSLASPCAIRFQLDSTCCCVPVHRLPCVSQPKSPVGRYPSFPRNTVSSRSNGPQFRGYRIYRTKFWCRTSSRITDHYGRNRRGPIKDMQI